MKTEHPTERYFHGYKYRIKEEQAEHRNYFSIQKRFLKFFWITPSTKFYSTLEEALEDLKPKIKLKNRTLYHYIITKIHREK